GDFNGTGRQLDDAPVAAYVGDKNRLQRLRFEIGTELGRDERHRERKIGRDRWHAGLPFAAPQRVVSSLGLYRLHEARAALANPKAQAVAPQRPLGRIVIGSLEVLSRALVARIGRDRRRIVEIRKKLGIDEQFEFEFAAP